VADQPVEHGSRRVDVKRQREECFRVVTGGEPLGDLSDAGCRCECTPDQGKGLDGRVGQLRGKRWWKIGPRRERGSDMRVSIRGELLDHRLGKVRPAGEGTAPTWVGFGEQFVETPVAEREVGSAKKSAPLDAEADLASRRGAPAHASPPLVGR
jgi:hypothetical protein